MQKKKKKKKKKNSIFFFFKVCEEAPKPKVPKVPKGPKPTCPPKAPVKDIEVPEFPTPVAHLAGGKKIQDGLNKLQKSLELLNYALKLKGVVVDAECVEKVHEINLDKLVWPRTEVIQLTNPTESTAAYTSAAAASASPSVAPSVNPSVAPSSSGPAAATSAAPATSAAATVAEVQKTLLEWIHSKTETVKPTPAPLPLEEKPLSYWQSQCRKSPENQYFCDPVVRKERDDAEKRKVEKEAKLKSKKDDLRNIETKLAQAQAARDAVKTEIEAGKLFGKPEEVKALENRLLEVQKLSDNIDTMYQNTKKEIADLEAPEKK